MDLTAFINSLKDEQPPSHCSSLLCALWYDGKGDWNRAHDIADGNSAQGADWVHAYLHRKEGDKWNARYWYQRAGRDYPSQDLEAEWEQLVEWFLKMEGE